MTQRLTQAQNDSSPAPTALEKIEGDLDHLQEDAGELSKDVIHSLEPDSFNDMKEEVVHVDAGHHEKNGMPQLDTSSFASQTFWFVITFALLYALMSSHIVPRIREVLEKRRTQIGHDLDVAEKAKSDAQKARTAYEKELATARKKSGKILEDALEAIRVRQQLAFTELDTKLAKSIKTSEASIIAQRNAARDTIRPLATELTGLIVGKILNIKAAPAQVEAAISAEMQKRQ